MAVSVYDWMLAQKDTLPAKDGGVVSGTDDILVRILKSLDQMATKSPVSST